MPNVGPAEILVILVVALLVFGPHKLPEIAKQVGKAVRELRRMQSSLQDEVRDVLEPISTEAPAPTPKLPPRPEGREATTRDGRDDGTTTNGRQGDDTERGETPRGESRTDEAAAGDADSEDGGGPPRAPTR